MINDLTKKDCDSRMYLYVEDNYRVAFCCKLLPGHSGPHQDNFMRGKKQVVIITWTEDESNTVPA